MPPYREIRADFDRDTLVVYQAYCVDIAEAALAAGRFVTPFSLNRMTWIKPSFLWLMERSNWGRKANQERILAVRICRRGWEKALSEAVLTSFDPQVHRNQDQWRADFASATVHVQWDPERSLQGKKLDHRSIQVGIGRELIRQYAEEWITSITDMTPLTRKIRSLLDQGDHTRAKRQLPPERRYEVPVETARRLGCEA